MLAGDIFLLVTAYYLSHHLRFDGKISFYMHLGILLTLAWILPVKIAALFMFDLYKGMWRYTGIYDMVNLFKACIVSTGTIAIIILITIRFDGFSRGVLGIDCLLMFLFLGGFRVVIRLIYSRLSGERSPSFFGKTEGKIKRLLIIAAGDAGEKLLRVIRDEPDLYYEVVGFIDNDPKKSKQAIHGIPVLGLIKDIKKIAEKFKADEIIIAVHSATPQEMRSIVAACKSAGISYKTVPGLGDLVTGKVTVNAIREVRYEDLLGRDSVHLETDKICGYLTGKRVLVTGGAGSIGFELCRQIARYDPEKLIIVERNESGLYETELDLLAENPSLNTAAILGAIQNRERMENLFICLAIGLQNKSFKEQVVS